MLMIILKVVCLRRVVLLEPTQIQLKINVSRTAILHLEDTQMQPLEDVKLAAPLPSSQIISRELVPVSALQFLSIMASVPRKYAL